MEGECAWPSFMPTNERGKKMGKKKEIQGKIGGEGIEKRKIRKKK